MNRLALFVSLIALSANSGIALAELSLASPFTDNAVLQRDRPVPIWGTSAPEATVTVQFARQTKTAVADSEGHWKVTLDPMPASQDPRDLSVTYAHDKQSHKITNVLVGEVWICSGQSNMQFAATSCPDIKELIPKARRIRSFAVKRTVAFEEQTTLEGEWIESHPNSAVAFSFAYFLEKQTDVPVGIILTCWGSSSLEAWMPRDMVNTVPHFRTLMQEFDRDNETQERIQSILSGRKPWSREDDIFLRRQSNLLYNAMMHPLAPYGCRGLVWYQGERNTQSMDGMLKEPWYSRNSGMLKYGDTLKQWIRRYRQDWRNEEMEFLIVMLPGFFKALPTGPQLGPEHPATHSWAWMRESQLKASELPNTNVVNTIDLGDVNNIHPKDKLPIGKRLALLATRNTLVSKGEAEGPSFKQMERKGDRIVIHFRNAVGLQTSDGQEPAGFWLAGPSRRWLAAEASIRGESVTLHAQKLFEPLHVRYAFAGKPKVNLINQAGLPAVPFRTDSFSP
ncbi:MAG: sialate O-acetylesterase [Planctomycetota bacterium]